ncbi:phosphoribosylformylglycinamidine synthase subunit PurS [Pyrobaculum aerophilum]|uniref:Phosphoribosylformylglycinamidine synthase n=1 Tax=Pyrobaculum aerophilum TaxID=13773 RepID=A0A371R525_9CREN|nr:phosphoribosylformylglycinamidine synthase subunit PurS [Pyrobaculum aerophilum]MCX8137166.1 phosphoribosylformylglycinamidine synthase subunit PurS [Pyrobaculum aerophilum]RFA94578.1 phosphoribosylformylglycinamidine synthase [Pyrobaculum aerophilum]RFA99182.1 phosphoribosylformylglycinamidine synthase [Pyrobaculum aerophilum]
MKYAVYLNVTYKPSIRDPEGETISKDLLARLGYSVEVRAGKCLVLVVDAQSPDEAASNALKIAKEARLGNPNVHVVEVLKVAPL